MPFIVLSNRSEPKTVDGKRLDDTVLFGLGGLITKKHNKKVVECRLFQVSLLRETISFTHFSKIFKWNSCGQPLTIGIVGFIRVDREMLCFIQIQEVITLLFGKVLETTFVVRR